MIRRLIAALLCFGCSANASAAAAQKPDTGPLVIQFADVGQGDAALIITPEGKRVLIDAGPSARTMEKLFFESTYDTLDLVVASHNHSDHIGGMPWVFGRFVVRAYMDNGVPHTTSIYRQTLRAAEQEPGLQYFQATQRTVTVGSTTLRVLPPPLMDRSQNNNSVGILLEYGRFRALYTGDAETGELQHWLRTAKVPEVQLVKSGHHGSFNGATAEWIRATRPAVVVVSVSRRNAYGHPSTALLAAWERAGAKVYRTDLEQAITIAVQRDGSFQVLTTARDVISVNMPR